MRLILQLTIFINQCSLCENVFNLAKHQRFQNEAIIIERNRQTEKIKEKHDLDFKRSIVITLAEFAWNETLTFDCVVGLYQCFASAVAVAVAADAAFSCAQFRPMHHFIESIMHYFASIRLIIPMGKWQ